MQLCIVISLRNAERDVYSLFDSIVAYGRSCQVIVWDGCSTDSTVERVAQYSKTLVNMDIKVGLDTGIYDAWNKALAHCDSSWVMFLGAGDRLVKPLILDLPDASREIYSLGVVARNSGVNLSRKMIRNLWRAPWFGIPSPNPGTVYPRRALLQAGGFDCKYKIAGDYEMQLRLLGSGHNINRSFVNMVAVEFGSEGISSQRSKIPESLREMATALRSAGNFGGYIFMEIRALTAQLKNLVLKS